MNIKLSSVMVTILLILSLLPVQAIAATTIGQDVSRSLPILTEMEIATEASDINTQITSVGGTAKLTKDRIAGNYAISVKVGDIANETDIKYILKDSATFTISNYSQVKLWVKPGEDAQWAEFYIRDTNEPTSNEIAINSDQDQDGKYTVGVDLVSGQWNEVTLDLTKIATSLTQGQDLVVKTNDDSTWIYDALKSVHTSVTSLDLSHMISASTEIKIIDSTLQFKTNGDNTFDTTPTVLVSNRYPSFRKTDSTQAEFSAGTLDNVEATGDGNVKFLKHDQTAGGTAISGGDYSIDFPSSKAFDNNLGTYWRSSQSGSSVSSVPAYIGYNFNQATTVYGFTIKQSNSATYGVTSVTLQYYDSSWKDLQTFTLSNTTAALQDLRVDKLVAATQWRLKPNTNPQNWWYVHEIEFWTYGSYTSPEIDISSLTSASNSIIAWETNEGAELKVETRVSDDGGITWQPDWTTVSNGGVIPGINNISNFANAKLQYLVSIDQPQYFSAPTLPELNEINIEIIGDYQNVATLPAGKISSVAVESGYSSTLRSGIDLSEKSSYLIEYQPTIFALSGDGSRLFYSNPKDSNKLYMLNLNNGEVSKKSDYIADISIKANYDGTKVAFMRTSSNYLYYFNDDLTNKESSISYYVTDYDIQNDGTVLYSEANGTEELHLYKPDGNDTVINTISSNYYVAISKENDNVYYANSTNLYRMELISGTWKSNGNILSTSSTIQDIWTNDTSSLVYLKYGDKLYSFDVQSKALRKLDLPSDIYPQPQRVTKDDQLIFQDIQYDILLYNPDADKSYSIKPSDTKHPPAYTTLYFDVNSDGDKMAYVSKDANDSIYGIKTYYFNGVERPERNLLSFDGKKSWYTYQGGNWTLVSTELTPSNADFATFGLTVDEVNALSEADFASLYDGNQEIYNFDVAVYFASVDPYTTPSLKSIKVTVNQDSTATEYLDKPLYAAKEKDFDDATSWYKLNKLYPVEVAPREAEYYYFIRINDGADNFYRVYKDDQWIVESTGNTPYADMLDDVEANWIDITQNGMTAAELRAIPASDLDALTGTNFSVVYAMKVNDTSTNNYSSLITADYVQDLFTGASYTLKVTLSDGTLKQYTSLTDNNVENFMEWINGRQYELGQVFYQLTTATGKDFLNYFKIQAVTVE